MPARVLVIIVLLQSFILVCTICPCMYPYNNYIMDHSIHAPKYQKQTTKIMIYIFRKNTHGSIDFSAICFEQIIILS